MLPQEKNIQCNASSWLPLLTRNFHVFVKKPKKCILPQLFRMLLWLKIHTLRWWWVTCRWFWRRRRTCSTPRCCSRCPWYTRRQQWAGKTDTASSPPTSTRIFLCNPRQTRQQHLQNETEKTDVVILLNRCSSNELQIQRRSLNFKTLPLTLHYP